jgi:hypothetical protein
MHQAETIRRDDGLGLASVWTHVNCWDYDTARADMDRVLGDIPRGLLAVGAAMSTSILYRP